MKLSLMIKAFSLSLVLGFVPLCLSAMDGFGFSGSDDESCDGAPAPKRARSSDGRYRSAAGPSGLRDEADEADHVSPTPPPVVERGDDAAPEEEPNYVFFRTHWRDTLGHIWNGFIRTTLVADTFVIQIDLDATGIGRLRLDNFVVPGSVVASFFSAIPGLVRSFTNVRDENIQELLHHLVDHPSPDLLLVMMVNFLQAAPVSNLPRLMTMLQAALEQIGITVHFQPGAGVQHAGAAAAATDLPTPFDDSDGL